MFVQHFVQIFTVQITPHRVCHLNSPQSQATVCRHTKKETRSAHSLPTFELSTKTYNMSEKALISNQSHAVKQAMDKLPPLCSSINSDLLITLEALSLLSTVRG
jgi:hypothetical protein